MVDQKNSLSKIAKELVASKKGILAADESIGTMKKRFDTINVPSTLENRLLWRQIMVTTKEVETAISGVILFDETLRNPLPDGTKIAEVLRAKGINTGIKVDKGTVKFNSAEETFTVGLDGLSKKLEEYKGMGAVFTKWRAVYKVGEGLPSKPAITANSIGLAEYALLAQKAGFVPIVEPEVLVLEGAHNIAKSEEVTELVLKDVFHWLIEFGVDLSCMLLKPNMVLPGKENANQSNADEIAQLTIETLRLTVPKKVPGIVFLSGGLSPEKATDYLKTMNFTYKDVPWELSYSFGRALQQEGLQTWVGKKENIKNTQQVFISRCKKVSEAR